MAAKNEYSLHEVIQELVRCYNLEYKLTEVKLNAAWENLVGPVIAKHTIKITHQNNIMFIYLDSAALKEDLAYSKTKIIRLLNKAVGCEALKDVQFR